MQQNTEVENNQIKYCMMKNIFRTMRKYGILISYTLLIASCSQTFDSLRLEQTEAAQHPRNVVFILSDDHRYDFMGFTGKVPWLETPHMDKLAKNGRYFPNTFVTTSLCSPSRASILTGLYSHSHEIVDNQAPMPDGLTFFPEYLQKAGYQTAFFGKWHMGDMGDNVQPGFDHWESFKGQGSYYKCKLNINGERVEYPDSTYMSELLTEHSIDWLKNRDSEKPFFLYLSHKAVHAEFLPSQKHNNMYKDEELIIPKTFEMTKQENLAKDGKSYADNNSENPDYNYGEGRIPDWVKEQRFSWHGVDYPYHGQQKFEDFFIKYCETIKGVDESIGSVMAYLEKNGLLESTLVIYMGDNGFSFGEHGLIDKRHFYEESVKVPFIVHCPDLVSGGEYITKMVQNIDVAPTILDVAGLKAPNHFHGKSIVPLLKGEEVEWRDKIFYEYYWEYDFPMTPTVHGVRTEKYKYIRYHGVWDTNELYDLENDPDEKNNLITSPEHQQIVKELADELYAWLETSDGMQIPLKRTIKHRWGDYRNMEMY